MFSSLLEQHCACKQECEDCFYSNILALSGSVDPDLIYMVPMLSILLVSNCFMHPKHNHLSKQFVCAASSCYGLSTTLLWSVPQQICHLGTQLQSNETICLSKHTCRTKTVHLLLMNKFQKMCTLCENCEPKEGQIE